MSFELPLRALQASVTSVTVVFGYVTTPSARANSGDEYNIHSGSRLVRNYFDDCHKRFQED